MSKSKDIFFYSSFSKYSEQCIQLIIKKNLHSKFIFINIDKHKGNIPSIITKVPTILTISRQLKIDNHIVSYINEKEKQLVETFNNDGKINDYMIGNDDFQFITNDDSVDNHKENNTQLKGFALWDQDFLITTEAKNGTAKIVDNSNQNQTQSYNQQQSYDKQMNIRNNSFPTYDKQPQMNGNELMNAQQQFQQQMQSRDNQMIGNIQQISNQNMEQKFQQQMNERNQSLQQPQQSHQPQQQSSHQQFQQQIESMNSKLPTLQSKTDNPIMSIEALMAQRQNEIPIIPPQKN